MAKNAISAQDMASKLMGAGVAPAKSKMKPIEPQGTKRLNLDISIPQWRKLKSVAMDRNQTVSDVVRDWIDGL